MTSDTCRSGRAVRVYFLGSGRLGTPILGALYESPLVELVGIGTQPDRPSGRHRHLSPTPLGEAAELLGLRPNKPADINAEEFINHLAKLSPDLLVVVSFGQILRQSLLVIPAKGCLNVHASLLPSYRGASPIQAAILAGDEETGVSFMAMDPGLDTGPVYHQVRVPLEGSDTAASLEERLAEEASRHIVDVVADVCLKGLQPVPQDDSKATYARKIKKHQGLIDWRQQAAVLARQVRAFQPWPGSSLFVPGRNGLRRIQVTQASAVGSATHGFGPGEVVQADKHGWTIACGRGFLNVLRVVPEGRPEMAADDYLRGAARVVPGLVLPMKDTE